MASWIEAKKYVGSHPKGTFKDSEKELGPFSIVRSVMFLKQSDFFTFCHLMQLMLWVLNVTPAPHFCLFVADDMGMVKQMFVFLDLAIERGKVFVTCLPLIVW